MVIREEIGRLGDWRRAIRDVELVLLLEGHDEVFVGCVF